MKKIILCTAFILLMSSSYVYAQKETNSKKNNVVLVTHNMSAKIAGECLYGNGYSLAVFYKYNKLSFSEICNGKGKEILNDLDKHPEYSENFIFGVYKDFGYKGLKDIGFSDEEIILSKKIVENKSK